MRVWRRVKGGVKAHFMRLIQMMLKKPQIPWLLICGFIVVNILLSGRLKLFQVTDQIKIDDIDVQNSTYINFPSISTALSTVGLLSNPIILKKPSESILRPETKIPNIVHFVYGMEKGAVFGLVQYLSIASASAVLKPTHIYMHCTHLPSGFYWDLLVGIVEVRRIKEINSVFGNPVTHYAHKADVARLRALLEYGGIYLDLDVISLSSFDHLLNNDFVMGQEGENGRIGLCNAVIIASNESKFLRIWYDNYASFNQSHWNYHSVLLPGKLAAENPDYITVLNHTTFFWPLWDTRALDVMYRSHEYQYTDNLAVHLWNSAAVRDHSAGMSMIWLLQNRSTLLSKLDVYLPKPLFTVIMPCYNQRQYIGDAIASVVSQSWPLWEIIVIDVGSPDGCGRFVTDKIAPAINRNSPRPFIKVIFTVGNIGLAQARNIGIAAAAGLWICALDADDRIGKDYFLEAEKALTRDPDINIIYSNQQFFGASGWLWDVPVFDAQSALTSGPFPVMTLYPRKLWKLVQGYSSALPYGNEDYDFWMKLMEVGLRAHKLAGSHTFYRYKLHSMMRDSSNFSLVEKAMLQTRHLTLLSLDTIFTAHRVISDMQQSTYSLILEKVRGSKPPGNDVAYHYFWLGLSQQRSGNNSAAASLFSSAMAARNPALKWQPTWYYASLMCLTDTLKARQLLEKTLAKYPELAVYHDVQETIRNCVDFNVPRLL